MLEKFLKTVETKELTKQEQKNLNGGDMAPFICWDIWQGYFPC